MLQIITPFTIYFNARFVYQKWELWRLLTNFMFFGSLGELLPVSVPCLLQQCTDSTATDLKVPMGDMSYASWLHVVLPWHTYATPMPGSGRNWVRSMPHGAARPGLGSSRGSQKLFLYAGLDFVFHMFFLVKYSKSLEEGSFRGRSADFLWMLLFGGAFLHVGVLCGLCSAAVFRRIMLPSNSKCMSIYFPV